MTLAAITATLAAFGSTSASASTVPPTTEPPAPDLDMAGNELETSPVEATVLTATYDLGLERPRGQVLQRFIEEVEAASGGAITIDVTVENPDSFEQWSNGDFDITLAPTRTLDTMGVTTLDVLSLPFLVQDDDQADRVATSDAANVMMVGLSAIDATGLVLVPVSQNHLAIYGDEPLRTVDQLHTGIRVYSPSNRIDQLFEAIGGHAAHDLSGEDWHDAIVSGEVLAADFPTVLAAATAPAPNEQSGMDVARSTVSEPSLSSPQGSLQRADGQANLEQWRSHGSRRVLANTASATRSSTTRSTTQSESNNSTKR